jgi:predicted amidohydrolase
MGDHRADRWSQGPPVFNESRWQAIMRTRALDTQLTFVVARNEGQGSCIVDRKGEFLAYNDGTEEIICATVQTDSFRTWNGGDFRGINWMQRRPHVYGEYVEAGNRGSL